MDKVLSQEEINALFSAMSSEQPSLDGHSERVSAVPRIAQYEYHCSDITAQDQVLRRKYDLPRKSRRYKAEENQSEQLYELIRMITVPVVGEILNSRLTLDDLLKVTKGDIIELDERVDDPVYLCVGGIAMFKGRIIQRGGKKAFEIFERLVDQASPK